MLYVWVVRDVSLQLSCICSFTCEKDIITIKLSSTTREKCETCILDPGFLDSYDFLQHLRDPIHKYRIQITKQLRPVRLLPNCVLLLRVDRELSTRKTSNNCKLSNRKSYGLTCKKKSDLVFFLYLVVWRRWI